MNQTLHGNDGIASTNDVSLRYLAAFLAMKWRALIMITAGTILLGLLLLTGQLLLISTNTEYIATAKYHYHNELSAYTNQVQALENEISLLSENIEKQKSYADHSILMKIDPYHRAIASSIYYIDSGYQILPENTYQDIDYSSHLLKQYLTYLNGGEAYKQIMERFPEFIEELYIKEIISASVDYSASTISITIIGESTETCLAVLDVISTGMEQVYQRVSDIVIAHKLTEISRNSYTAIDLSLAEKQQQHFDQILSFTRQLEDKNLELLTLRQTKGEPANEFSFSNVAKRFVKRAVYSALIGLVLAIIMLSAYYIASDKLLDTDKSVSALHISIMGTIPREKQRVRVFDKFASRFSGIKALNRASALQLAVLNIHAAVLAKGLTNGSVALVGSISMDEMESIAKAFNEAVPNAQLQFIAAGNPLRDAVSAQFITASSVMVFVEKQGVSLCSEIRREQARIHAWAKEVLGLVLLDTDNT